MCFHAFGQYFRLSLDIELQKPENISYVPLTENRNEKLLLVSLVLPPLFR